MAEKRKQKKEKQPADFSAAFPSALIGIAAIVATPFVIRAYHEPLLTACMMFTSITMFSFSEIMFRHTKLGLFQLDLNYLKSDLSILTKSYFKYFTITFIAIIAERLYLGDLIIK